MKDKNRFKETLYKITNIVCFIGILVCCTISIVISFTYPDKTEIRLLIEYPAPTIGCIILMILYGIIYKYTHTK